MKVHAMPIRPNCSASSKASPASGDDGRARPVDGAYHHHAVGAALRTRSSRNAGGGLPGQSAGHGGWTRHTSRSEASGVTCIVPLIGLAGPLLHAPMVLLYHVIEVFRRAQRRVRGERGIEECGDHDRRYRAAAPHPKGTVRTGTSGRSRPSGTCSLERGTSGLNSAR
jgi:hypothetical protein